MSSDNNINSYLTDSDLIVLDTLFEDVARSAHDGSASSSSRSSLDSNATLEAESEAISRLKAFNDPNSPDFAPAIFATWDDKDIPVWINRNLVRPYARVASRIVRHPTDVIFFTHILVYLFVNVPSALYLFHHFTYLHGVLHVAFTFWFTGSFTLMLHNHIHNNGVLAKEWFWLDYLFPYVTEPLFGHTWNSYYYHHVKHHHVEGNGPEDLSSTIRYQRDDVFHFLHYLGRFLLFVGFELTYYFIRKKKYGNAIRGGLAEFGSYAFMYTMLRLNLRPAIFVLLIPFVLLRLGLMVGNWGQHALVDEVEPDSDFRSSITLIDVPSNRFCFNDGYHTAHHLNPRRHWRDQPIHFLQSKAAYADGRALVFHNIDYLMMTMRLLRKDYMHLASCLVPIGDQIGMSQQQIADMLRTKTRRFTEDDIRRKFGGASMNSQPSTPVQSMMSRIQLLFKNLGEYAPIQLSGNEATLTSRKAQ